MRKQIISFKGLAESHFLGSWGSRGSVTGGLFSCREHRGAFNQQAIYFSIICSFIYFVVVLIHF